MPVPTIECDRRRGNSVSISKLLGLLSSQKHRKKEANRVINITVLGHW
jgi:hypothetical protein